MLLSKFVAVVKSTLRIVRLISKDLVIRSGTTVLQRDMVIADGVDVLIEDGGELLLL